MSHEHSHQHSHAINAESLNKAFIIGIVLNLAFVVIEFAAGFWFDSLALLSDAGHNLSDVVSLVLALLAFRLAKVKANERYTYGYKKSTILVSLLNAVILLVAVGAIVIESIHKLNNPAVVPGGAIAWVAGVGVLINAFTAFLFMKDKEKDLNVKGAYLQCSVYQAYQNTEAPFPNYRLSESNIRFDARKELAGWNQPSFEGKLGPAIEIGFPNEMPFGKLVPRPIPMWKDSGLREYPEVVKNETGDTIRCRLPYNCQITPYLHVKAPAGLKIGMLTDNYTGGSANNVRAEYITREGDGCRIVYFSTGIIIRV